jgi:hypothetical protein
MHWAFIARRYRDIPNRNLSFNLLNEPGTVDGSAYARAVSILCEAIRREDPNRLIIADGLSWGTEPCRELVPLGVAQATRGYQPLALTHYRADWVDGSDSRLAGRSPPSVLSLPRSERSFPARIVMAQTGQRIQNHLNAGASVRSSWKDLDRHAVLGRPRSPLNRHGPCLRYASLCRRRRYPLSHRGQSTPSGALTSFSICSATASPASRRSTMRAMLTLARRSELWSSSLETSDEKQGRRAASTAEGAACLAGEVSHLANRSVRFVRP